MSVVFAILRLAAVVIVPAVLSYRCLVRKRLSLKWLAVHLLVPLNWLFYLIIRYAIAEKLPCPGCGQAISPDSLVCEPCQLKRPFTLCCTECGSSKLRAGTRAKYGSGIPFTCEECGLELAPLRPPGYYYMAIATAALLVGGSLLFLLVNLFVSEKSALSKVGLGVMSVLAFSSILTVAFGCGLWAYRNLKKPTVRVLEPSDR